MEAGLLVVGPDYTGAGTDLERGAAIDDYRVEHTENGFLSRMCVTTSPIRMAREQAGMPGTISVSWLR